MNLRGFEKQADAGRIELQSYKVNYTNVTKIVF